MNNLYLPQANLTIYQKEAYYSGIKIFNNLPLEICSETIFVHLFILCIGTVPGSIMNYVL